jgi:glycosyltransferase involved in cell wall biosynthesis
MQDGDLLTVIIPTLADSARANQLLRAIRSILALDVPARALVVVNGNSYDTELLQFAALAGAEVVFSPVAGVSEARLFGRKKVRTPYFGFLDDDDELLPNAGCVRLEGFTDTCIDVVVTNGYSVNTLGERIPFRTIPPTNKNPAMAILEENWLASPAAFFGTTRVTTNEIKSMPNVMEWTVLGFQLALKHKILFLPAFTYHIHNDAPNRLSKSVPFLFGEVKALEYLSALTKEPDLKRYLRRKLSIAHHATADQNMQANQIVLAWKHHYSSMLSVFGLRYIFFTRHLLYWHVISLTSKLRRLFV